MPLCIPRVAGPLLGLVLRQAIAELAIFANVFLLFLRSGQLSTPVNSKSSSKRALCICWRSGRKH